MMLDGGVFIVAMILETLIFLVAILLAGRILVGTTVFPVLIFLVVR